MAVVERVRPTAVLIENVPDLPAWDDGAVLIGFYESLRELGYASMPEFSTPSTTASRSIARGSSSSVFASGRRMHWPEPRRITSHSAGCHRRPSAVPPAQRDERIPYLGGPRDAASSARCEAIRASDERRWIHDHITRDVRPDDAEAFALLERADLRRPTEHLRRYRSDIFTDKYKRLAWDEVSRTITAHIAKDGYWYIHPEQHRTLSIREAARVQTFPDWFRFAGSRPTGCARSATRSRPGWRPGSGPESRNPLVPRPTRRRSAADNFRRDLLGWHAESARRYPWREAGLEPVAGADGRDVPSSDARGPGRPCLPSLRTLAPTPEAMVEQQRGGA